MRLPGRSVSQYDSFMPPENKKPAQATTEQIDDWENKRCDQILNIRDQKWEEMQESYSQMRERAEKIQNADHRSAALKTWETAHSYKLTVLARQVDAEFEALQKQTETARQTGQLPENKRTLNIATMFADKNLDHDDGHVLFWSIQGALDFDNTVCLDFAGQDIVTPSFLNTSLRAVAQKYDQEFLKERLSITNGNSTINNMVREALINRGPIKATEEQIDRWQDHQRQKLREQEDRRIEESDRRKEQLIEKAKSDLNPDAARIAIGGIEMTFEQERLKISQLSSEALHKLESDLKKARETGAIPDKDFAPTHTKAEINKWAKEYAADLTRHQNEFMAGLHEQFSGDELQSRLNLADRVHHGQWQTMQDEIFTAHEIGRIHSDQYKPEHERDSAHEQGHEQ